MLVWLDLEMTGLDIDSDVIVEIATLVTDDNLVIVAEGPDIVVSAPAERLDAMNDVVRTMHEKSGLLTAVQASTVSLEEAGLATLDFIREHVPQRSTAPLCGNSIGVDRRFLAKYLPEIETYLHYRSVDVSSVKELGRRWNPAVVSAAPRKTSMHRALDDIRESVAELAYYRDTFFRLPEPRPSSSLPDRVPESERSPRE
jgi:oligoribonuclease